MLKAYNFQAILNETRASSVGRTKPRMPGATEHNDIEPHHNPQKHTAQKYAPPHHTTPWRLNTHCLQPSARTPFWTCFWPSTSRSLRTLTLARAHGASASSCLQSSWAALQPPPSPRRRRHQEQRAAAAAAVRYQRGHHAAVAVLPQHAGPWVEAVGPFQPQPLQGLCENPAGRLRLWAWGVLAD